MQNLKEYFSYKKFRSELYRILFLDNNYFLQKQTIQVLRQLGHQVMQVPGTNNAGLMLKAILKNAIEFKPDCIISFNHEGFDPDGKIAGILHEFNLPVLIWYLDDFRFILPNYDKQVYDNIMIFSFEKSNIGHLRNIGFEHVFYLPTASVIDPGKKYSNRQYYYLNDSIVFVGNSFQETIIKWERPEYQDWYAEISNKIKAGIYGEKLIKLVREKQGGYFKSEETFQHYCGYVAAKITQIKRETILNSLSDHSLHVFGDNYWSQLIKNGNTHQGLEQEREAPQVYVNAGININISSAQLDTAVNLRVFDIPASNGFMITDWRESLYELFDEKKEIVAYHDKAELKELIDFYKKYPENKQEIIKAAKKRVQNEHLLYHRVNMMLINAAEIFY